MRPIVLYTFPVAQRDAKKVAQFVYLFADQYEALRDEKRASGDSMSVVVREGIDLALERRKRDRGGAR